MTMHTIFPRRLRSLLFVPADSELALLASFALATQLHRRVDWRRQGSPCRGQDNAGRQRRSILRHGHHHEGMGYRYRTLELRIAHCGQLCTRPWAWVGLDVFSSANSAFLRCKGGWPRMATEPGHRL